MNQTNLAKKNQIVLNHVWGLHLHTSSAPSIQPHRNTSYMPRKRFRQECSFTPDGSVRRPARVALSIRLKMMLARASNAAGEVKSNQRQHMLAMFIPGCYVKRKLSPHYNVD